MEKLYTVRKIRPGADCGSDHELLLAKFRLKLKKVGKTTRPFRYDWNQILYDYTVEVRNRFKGLDLIDRVPEELRKEVVDILGISELKWAGMCEFNSDDYYIYYCGQESIRRNGVAIMVNKRVWNAVLGCNLKNDRIVLFVSKSNHSISW